MLDSDFTAARKSHEGGSNLFYFSPARPWKKVVSDFALVIKVMKKGERFFFNIGKMPQF